MASSSSTDFAAIDNAPLRAEELPTNAVSFALRGYLDAYKGEQQTNCFITCYSASKDKGLIETQISRAQFWRLASRAARLLKHELGLSLGDSHVHFFSGNTVEDLILRMAAVLVGTVPVTVNWDGDTLDRIIYKVKASSARVVFTHGKTPTEQVEGVKAAAPDVKVVDVERLWRETEMLPISEIEAGVAEESTRIIIYTSGSSGEPKGVMLPYRSYVANRQTFESFLQITDASDVFAPVLVNPLHHTNSTAFSDWALRRPGTQLHLFERYTTAYWGVLARVATGMELDQLAAAKAEELEGVVTKQKARGLRVMAPTVSRHFDFLESLVGEGKLPIDHTLLRTIAPVLTFIIGSAPVGPTTITRFQKYLGRLPTVRFGSTETCLQVMGIPLSLPTDAQLEAFKKGWEAPDQPGFYIGRPHPPFTEVMVVQSLDKADKDRYLVEVAEGDKGYLVTRGQNLMSGYVHGEEATRRALDKEAGGWYLNLGDLAFWRKGSDGEKDFYWVSRTSNLLIKGGSNYSYNQISDELSKFVARQFRLAPSSFALAAVGRRFSSEHDDDCLVMIELLEPEAKAEEEAIVKEFIREARRAVSKGAKPDRLAIGSIPRNFKGDINWRQLESTWDEWLKQQAKTA